LNGVPSE